MSESLLLGRHEEVGDRFQVLASPVRVALVDPPADQERLRAPVDRGDRVGRLLVSPHPRELRDARPVRRVRKGREMAYALRDAHVAHIVRDAIAHAKEEGPA